MELEYSEEAGQRGYYPGERDGFHFKLFLSGLLTTAIAWIVCGVGDTFMYFSFGEYFGASADLTSGFGRVVCGPVGFTYVGNGWVALSALILIALVAFQCVLSSFYTRYVYQPPWKKFLISLPLASNYITLVAVVMGVAMGGEFLKQGTGQVLSDFGADTSGSGDSNRAVTSDGTQYERAGAGHQWTRKPGTLGFGAERIRPQQGMFGQVEQRGNWGSAETTSDGEKLYRPER